MKTLENFRVDHPATPLWEKSLAPTGDPKLATARLLQVLDKLRDADGLVWMAWSGLAVPLSVRATKTGAVDVEYTSQNGGGDVCLEISFPADGSRPEVRHVNAWPSCAVLSPRGAVGSRGATLVRLANAILCRAGVPSASLVDRAHVRCEQKDLMSPQLNLRLSRVLRGDRRGSWYGQFGYRPPDERQEARLAEDLRDYPLADMVKSLDQVLAIGSQLQQALRKPDQARRLAKELAPARAQPSENELGEVALERDDLKELAGLFSAAYRLRDRLEPFLERDAGATLGDVASAIHDTEGCEAYARFEQNLLLEDENRASLARVNWRRWNLLYPGKTGRDVWSFSLYDSLPWMSLVDSLTSRLYNDSPCRDADDDTAGSSPESPASS